MDERGFVIMVNQARITMPDPEASSFSNAGLGSIVA